MTDTPDSSQDSRPAPNYKMQIRVRYDEADPMGFVHHANYFRYFEICRTEMLRAAGGSYRDVEAAGAFVVVVRAEVKYRNPARYDDVLEVHLVIPYIGRAKVVHEYTIRRENEVLTTAELTLAVIDAEGKVRPIPDWMLDSLCSDDSH